MYVRAATTTIADAAPTEVISVVCREAVPVCETEGDCVITAWAAAVAFCRSAAAWAGLVAFSATAFWTSCIASFSFASRAVTFPPDFSAANARDLGLCYGRSGVRP
jgi:hypothetical protein